MKVASTLTKLTDVHHVELEHTALEELFQRVPIVPGGKLWHLVSVVQKVTVLGVSLIISYQCLLFINYL